MSARVDAHLAAFNTAVRSNDYQQFVTTFRPDARMAFVGVPVGPFHGREQIARAYAEQPPTDTMSVRDVQTDGDTDVIRFAWDAGGTGTMIVRWHDDLVADLTVAFD
jgi:steroid Delta-isomerase